MIDACGVRWSNITGLKLQELIAPTHTNTLLHTRNPHKHNHPQHHQKTHTHTNHQKQKKKHTKHHPNKHTNPPNNPLDMIREKKKDMTAEGVKGKEQDRETDKDTQRLYLCIVYIKVHKDTTTVRRMRDRQEERCHSCEDWTWHGAGLNPWVWGGNIHHAAVTMRLLPPTCGRKTRYHVSFTCNTSTGIHRAQGTHTQVRWIRSPIL